MLGFLIAAAAGFLTPQLEGPVAGPIVKALEPYFAIDPTEKRVIAFMVALLGAAIAAAFLNNGSAFGIILGAILGYFGTRILSAVKKATDGRSNTE